MTEAEWLASDGPEAMLAALRGKVSGRKLRLFACACCDHFQAGLDLDSRLDEAASVARAFADGAVPLSRLRRARRAAEAASLDNEVGLLNVAVADDDAFAAALRSVQIIATTYAEMCVPCESLESARGWMSADIVRFLREVCDGWWLPPRDWGMLRAWNGGTIAKLAEAIYAEWGWERLPVLGDALEEAGCDDEAILTHLRSGGRHVRGCWALDLVLGKE
jgi:hypothetical protein